MLRLFIVFFLPVFCVLANEPQLNAEHWLEKMSQSMKTLNYQGTIAFFKNGRLDTMKYTHSNNHNVEQERLLSLNSPMREVIRDTGKVSCIFSKSNKIVVNHRPVSKSFVIDLPNSFVSLNGAYNYSLGEEESVAMRSSRIVFIQPVDQYRYARKIWIDKEHFLPLKVEVYDGVGKVLEQVVFTEIQIIDKIAFVKLDNKLETGNVKHIQVLESVPAEAMSFVVEGLPAGFEVVFFTRMSSGNTDKNVDHLLLSDGFSSVSVYREEKHEDVQLGAQTVGSVNSYTRVNDEFQITAMGDVPVKAVQVIAQGVTLQ